MDHGGIIEDEIVRLHLPAPSKGGGGRQAEQHNRGFAYIDFTTKDVAGRAIALSEKLLHGRRVLIKDAKNFEGRPLKEEQQAQNGEGAGGKAEKKEPTKRVFVGNLGFDVTREDIIELFSPAGDVEDVFLATFEDSGKCKGFGWVRFGTVEAAQAAVKGYLYRDMDQDGFHDGDDSDAEIITEKKSKPEREKLWVNRLQGRQLRCEFAEDAQTRYRKRFSKDGVQESRDRRTDGETGKPHGSNGDGIGNANSAPSHHMESAQEVVVQSMHSKVRSKPGKEERREERRKRHDARSIAPGKALANTHRASGAIVAGSGTKVQFD
jgi:RNA recognition motif-containing protein